MGILLMGRRGIGCTLERRVATPFSRTGQIYRSGPAIRSLVFGIPGLNGAESSVYATRFAIGNADPLPSPSTAIPSSGFFSTVPPPPLARRRWNSRGTPRQRSHCFSLNNTSAIFELRCQRERYRILLPFCAVQTPPSPEKTGNERERERGTKQHYPAIKRRVLSTVRSFSTTWLRYTAVTSSPIVSF